MADTLRVGVIGVGHFGKNHDRVYSELEGVTLVGVADADAERAKLIAGPLGVRAFADARELLGAVDAVSVAVPTTDHARVACECLSRGVSVLVEKPMAATLSEARDMESAAQASDATLQIGHIMRFTPAVLAVREMNVEPKFVEVHRLSPFSFRSLDVGVVLDMMIHDIDLVLELTSGRIEKVDAVAFALVGKTEDICNARVTFDDGCVANLTASRVAMKTMRKVRIFSPQGYIALDFDRNYGLLIVKSPDFDPAALDADKLKGQSLDQLKGLMLDKFFTMREMELTGEEPLKAEVRSFVNAVRTKTPPLVSAEDGIRSMEAAERILEAVRAHKWT